MFMLIFFNKVRTTAEQYSHVQVKEGLKGCNLFFEKLNLYLKNQDFLVGSKFSMGDISIGSIMYRYYEMDIDRPELRFVNKWYQRLIDRPAYQKNVMIPFGRNLSEWLDHEKVNAGIQ